MCASVLQHVQMCYFGRDKRYRAKLILEFMVKQYMLLLNERKHVRHIWHE